MFLFAISSHSDSVLNAPIPTKTVQQGSHVVECALLVHLFGFSVCGLFSASLLLHFRIRGKLLFLFVAEQSNVAGRVQEEMNSVAEQRRDLALSLMIIFALLAIPLRSYSQPLLIMSVIPFGVVGAIYGHVIMGMTMSSLSFFGIIAVAGVVVNDSLVMVDYVNKARAEGIAIKQAVVDAGCKRFRAILLTSITTFIGLVPIIMETSLQAQIVIPMAVSLAFGVLFATVITLILIPCQYVALEDFKRLTRKLLGKEQKVIEQANSQQQGSLPQN